MAASPCLKTFMLPGGPLYLSILPFPILPRGKLHFPIAVGLLQNNSKVEKFCCVLYWLDALRGLIILVSSGSIARYVLDATLSWIVR
jgi:hypothetical protein